MNWRTPLARTVYWVGGQVARVKYPSKMYQWIPREEREARGITGRDVGSMTELLPERSWIPHPWGTVLAFGVAHRIDPVHYDHWALVHDGCAVHRCPGCGGDVCAEDSDWGPDSVGTPHAFGGGRRFR